MESVSPVRRIISCILKVVVVISAAAGTFLSAYAGRGTFMGGVRVFMYFTIQSNIAIAIVCAAGIFMMFRGKRIGSAWYVIKFVATVAITLTGVVFAAVLAPTLGNRAWTIPNTLTHVVVPVAAVIDFFVTASGAGIKKRNVFFVIIPPLLYAVYAGIGYNRGWEFSEGCNYPYFFLNWGSPAGAFGFTDGLPYLGCGWWILLLLAFLVIVGHCYLFIADRLGAKSKR